MVLSVTVTIGEDEVSLDINEAKELYNDLKKLFDTPTVSSIPGGITYTPSHGLYDTTVSVPNNMIRYC